MSCQGNDLSLFMLTLIQYHEVVFVSFSPVKLLPPPLSELHLLKSQCAWPTFQKRGVTRAELTIEFSGLLHETCLFSPTLLLGGPCAPVPGYPLGTPGSNPAAPCCCSVVPALVAGVWGGVCVPGTQARPCGFFWRFLPSGAPRCSRSFCQFLAPVPKSALSLRSLVCMTFYLTGTSFWVTTPDPSNPIFILFPRSSLVFSTPLYS